MFDLGWRLCKSVCVYVNQYVFLGKTLGLILLKPNDHITCEVSRNQRCHVESDGLCCRHHICTVFPDGEMKRHQSDPISINRITLTFPLPNKSCIFIG